MTRRQIPSHRPARTLSRRRFVLLLGAGGVAATTCASSMAVFLLLARQENTRQAIRRILATQTAAAQLTATPEPIVRPPIVPRDEWGALPPDHTVRNEHGFYSMANPEGWRVYLPPIAEIYRTAVIHHSAFFSGNDISTLLEIQRQHREQRQWADIAYHFLVGKSGTIYEGRALNVRGTHVEGFNTGSVGICLLGDFRYEQPTQAQLDAALQLVRWLAAELQLTHLAGHSDFNPDTTCPGAHVIPYLRVLADGAGLTLGTGGYMPPPEQLTLTPPDPPAVPPGER